MKPNRPNKYVEVTRIEWERGYTVRYEELNEGKQLYSVLEYTKESTESGFDSLFLRYVDHMLRIRPTAIDRIRKKGRLWNHVFFEGNLSEVTKEEFEACSSGKEMGKHVRTLSKYVSETGIADLLVFQKG